MDVEQTMDNTMDKTLDEKLLNVRIYTHILKSRGNNCNNLSDEEIFNIVFEEWSQYQYNKDLASIYKDEILEESGILSYNNAKMQQINNLINNTKNEIESNLQELEQREKEEIINDYEMDDDSFIDYCKDKYLCLEV